METEAEKKSFEKSCEDIWWFKKIAVPLQSLSLRNDEGSKREIFEYN